MEVWREYLTDAERAEYESIERKIAEGLEAEDLMNPDGSIKSVEEFESRIYEYTHRKMELHNKASANLREHYRGRAGDLLEEITQKLHQCGEEEKTRHEERLKDTIDRAIIYLHKTEEEAEQMRAESRPGADTFFLYLLTESGLEDLFDTLEELGAEAAEESAEAIRRAQECALQAYPGENIDFSKRPPKIKAKPAKEITKPLDKVNTQLWRRMELLNNGQIAFEALTWKGKGEEAIVYVSVDFSGLEEENLKLTRSLTPYDKRVQECIYALYTAGNDTISLTQIYSLMSGNNTKAGAKIVEKINESITKMSRTHLYLDNADEAKLNYPHFSYDGAILPCERITATINGKVTDAAIHLFREPPLVSFAKGRKQITTISPELLGSPLNKTDENIQIEDYFIERIAHYKADKTGKWKGKILYETVFRECGITETKQKQRAPEKIRRLLDFYISKKWIDAYQEEKDGITIQAAKNQAADESEAKPAQQAKWKDPPAPKKK